MSILHRTTLIILHSTKLIETQKFDINFLFVYSCVRVNKYDKKYN